MIIPTRERGEVLCHALRTVVAQDFDELDILVSDNASTDDTRDIVHSFRDARIRYVNTGKRVSMSHNWEFALSHVRNGWVMVIGDDDGLLPGALQKVKNIAQATATKAITSPFVTFIWPREDNQNRGRLLIPMRQGRELRDARQWLSKVVRGAAWYTELPMLYVGGAIHTDLIDRVRNKSGRFFHSNQPDIYSTIALSSVTDTYVWSHEPVAIAGHSRHSNGASWMAAARAGRSGIEQAPNTLFMSEEIIPFHADLPLLQDGNLPMADLVLVYESYLQSKHLHGDPFQLNHAQALKLFRAKKYPHERRFDAWVREFAAHNGLAFDSPDRIFSSEKSRMRRIDYLQKIHAFRDLYRLEPSFGVRMRDVYDASLVTQAILRCRPSRVRSYRRTLMRWARRLFRSGKPAQSV